MLRRNLNISYLISILYNFRMNLIQRLGPKSDQALKQNIFLVNKFLVNSKDDFPISIYQTYPESQAKKLRQEPTFAGPDVWTSLGLRTSSHWTHQKSTAKIRQIL